MYEGNEFKVTLHRHAPILSRKPEEVQGRPNCHSIPEDGTSPRFPAPPPLAQYYNIIQRYELMSGDFRIKGSAPPQISPPISKVSSPSFISDDAFLSPPTMPLWSLSRVRNFTIHIWIDSHAGDVSPAHWNCFKFDTLSRMKGPRTLKIRVSTLPPYQGSRIIVSGHQLPASPSPRSSGKASDEDVRAL
jgi:hypothetical protein